MLTNPKLLKPANPTYKASIGQKSANDNLIVDI
jgi:hypothetical protein